MDGQRMFHLGDILSVTGCKLVSPTGFDGVRDLMSYIVGESLDTIQTRLLADDVGVEHLLKLYPWLADVDDSTVNRANVYSWLAEQVALHGEYLIVTPLLGSE